MPYTNSAEQALMQASDISKSLKHGYIGTEHIMLGLMSVEECVASKVLRGAGILYSNVEKLINEQIAPNGNVLVKDKDGYTKKVQKIFLISLKFLQFSLYHKIIIPEIIPSAGHDVTVIG